MFLGIDLSTQQIKACVLNGDNPNFYRIEFDHDLPEFGTTGGVIRAKNGEVYSPVHMWLTGFMLLFDRMKDDKVDFSQIKAISGCAQQHGSVYWNKNASEILSKLKSEKGLDVLLKEAFSKPFAPVWMDTSTFAECDILEKAAISAERLSQITGSSAHPRFTGPQIMKLYRQQPNVYSETKRISLISSFGASLFVGEIAPIDSADASGMNLLNIFTQQWDEQLLNVCAPDLRDRLGVVVPSKTVLSNICSYWVERYGFSQSCKVVAWTGDNPSSLVGNFVNGVGDRVISLGTSDVLMGLVSKPKLSSLGHVFISAIPSDAPFSSLLVYSNGAYTRQRIVTPHGDWDKLYHALEQTSPGCNGCLSIHWPNTEITPSGGRGVVRVNSLDEEVKEFDEYCECRSLIEGQFLAMRLHCEKLGMDHADRIFVTGGASKNLQIVQIISDVMNAPVFSIETTEAAAFGSALRAMYSTSERTVKGSHRVLAQPRSSAIYDKLLPRYEALENKLLTSQNNS